MKLLDYANCDEPTIKLAVINADTVRLPVSVPACEGFLIDTPCDAAGKHTFHYRDGHIGHFCKLHLYMEVIQENGE